MTNRTVTISTRDHGLVRIECPAWCEGGHADGGYLVDLTHLGPEVALEAPTGEGPVRTLLASLEAHPYLPAPAARSVFANIELDGAWYECTPGQLDDIAAALVDHAERLRALGRQLAAIQRGDR